MTNGTKDWANIRIEEPVRDEARDDERTYSEIMRAGLRVQQDGPTSGDVQDAFALPDEAIPDDLDERLAAIESAAKEATNAAQNAERAAEELGGKR